MKKLTLLIGLLGMLGITSEALAYGISGYIFCDANGDGVIDSGDTPLAGVSIVFDDGITPVTVPTDSTGFYDAAGVVGEGTWSVSIDGSTLSSEATVVLPTGGTHSILLSMATPFVENVNFLIDDPECQPAELGACWMTAGGVKFESILPDVGLAEKGPKDSFGGNVYPSCSPYPGNGGQWNHISHSQKLHFMGTDIEVIRCGNVPGIEPGSESPVTGFNFIEFQGVGWIQGIKGNKVARTPVTFTARVEDRNEPGNEQSGTAGEDIDRYYLNVPGFLEVSDEAGNPVTITGGNLQLHESSCE